MGWFDSIIQRFNKTPSGNAQLAMVNGNVPIYSQFGQNVYASDVVQQAIACIAQEISKLTPKHIRFDKNDLQVPVFDSISDLLEYGPNEWSTTKDFLEKITWQLYLNYNVFILPVYDEVSTTEGKARKYRALYPLDPTEVTFIIDGRNELYVDFRFNAADKLVVKYSDLIHWRYRYSVNPFMGGNQNGQPDIQGLLQTVEINHKLLQSIEKSVNSSMQIYGVMKYNTILDEDNMKSEIQRFEKMLSENKNGIIAADLKSEYIQIKPDPKLIDAETYVYSDNYGTTEEKSFVKYFFSIIEDLKNKYKKVFLIRNEQRFGIYSFDTGERFEPDYLLVLEEKESENNSVYYHVFVEPKGDQLLEQDKWKEEFLLKLKERKLEYCIFIDNSKYRIWGLPFYNEANKLDEFDASLRELT